ncbi:hypothetical protein KR99_23570, partial [Ralstonia solanacearum]
MALLHTQVDRDVSRVEQMLPEADGLTSAGLHDMALLARIAVPGRPPQITRAWQAVALTGTASNAGDAYWVERATNGRHYYVGAAMVRHAGVTYQVTVAEDIEQTYAMGRRLLWMLWGGLPFALLISLGGGYILAGRAIAPVGTMARMAREITADNLSQRLPVGDSGDEFGNLAATFNDTLQRLENAFAR